jgi:hypothetical protein
LRARGCVFILAGHTKNVAQLPRLVKYIITFWILTQKPKRFWRRRAQHPAVAEISGKLYPIGQLQIVGRADISGFTNVSSQTRSDPEY